MDWRPSKNTLPQCRILFIYECIMWLFIMQHLVQFTYDGWSHLLVTCHALGEVVTPLALFNCARLHKPFYTYLFNYPFHGIHMHLPSPLSFQLNVFNNPPPPPLYFTGFKVWPWNFLIGSLYLFVSFSLGEDYEGWHDVLDIWVLGHFVNPIVS
jgi:hypothetical protein